MKKTTGRILVSGFEPFGGASVNSSGEITRLLHGRNIRGHAIEGVILPCCFGVATRRLKQHLRRIRPELVICLGQAGERAEITPERIAINIDDARIPDNAGAQPIDKPVIKRGPAAYWSTLPIKAIVADLKARGVPASVSQTAGTFVCNHVFYGLMHALSEMPGVRGGFIHVPGLPQSARDDQPNMPLATMVDAIEKSIAVSLHTKRASKSKPMDGTPSGRTSIPVSKPLKS